MPAMHRIDSQPLLAPFPGRFASVRLVEPGDAGALANAVERLLRNPDVAKRLAAAALADCRARWLPDVHAQAKIAAIRELWLQSRPAATSA